MTYPTFRYTTASLIDLMAFDANDRMALINQPLLMMAGSKRRHLLHDRKCIQLATGTDNKELFLIEGATHIQTYYVPEYVDKAASKLGEFFDRYL